MSRAFLPSMHVGIVGAGLIGLACARALLAGGARVTVYERARAGEGAAWAAAGMLAAAAETLEEGDVAGETLAFSLESLRLWPEFAAGVERESGRPIDFRRDGSVLAALDADEERRLRAWAARTEALDLACELLEGAAAAREREPGLSPETRLAVFARDDWSVDARALVAALAVAVRSAGGEIREGAEVVDIAPGSGAAGAVLLVARADDVLREDGLDAVVVAAGWRASALASRLPALADVLPVKGQMLALRGGAAAPRHVVRGREAYLAPRSDGRVLVGATTEPGVATASTDAAVVERLRAAAIRLLPGLADAPVIETWSGVRPGWREDGRGPLVREIAPGVVAAAGHYRNGVLLAPATARRVAALVGRG